jgi:hypothetical protein
MKKALNLEGQKFGRLTVIRKAEVQWDKAHTRWTCLCICGNTAEPTTENLTSGNTKSCGCLRTTHGHSRHGMTTKEYKLLASARRRAKLESLPFNLELEDVVIPEYCPVLGIKINKEVEVYRQDDSPSIDKLIPALGYVKGNIHIMSWRANMLKRDASLQEMSQVFKWFSAEMEKAEK